MLRKQIGDGRPLSQLERPRHDDRRQRHFLGAGRDKTEQENCSGRQRLHIVMFRQLDQKENRLARHVLHFDPRRRK
jgi:hypothetical protein